MENMRHSWYTGYRPNSIKGIGDVKKGFKMLWCYFENLRQASESTKRILTMRDSL